jgi:hypothetical protein
MAWATIGVLLPPVPILAERVWLMSCLAMRMPSRYEFSNAMTVVARVSPWSKELSVGAGLPSTQVSSSVEVCARLAFVKVTTAFGPRATRLGVIGRRRRGCCIGRSCLG